MRASRTNRCTRSACARTWGCRSFTAAGSPLATRVGLVDLAHRPAPDDAPEAEAAEHLVAPAAEAARLQRLREILPRLAQERVAVGERADDAVVLLDGLQRRLARLALHDVRRRRRRLPG